MKTNKNITLNIKDLVLLKQYPDEYLKKELENLTIKTHDGTSSGPIKTALKDFVTQYSKTNYRVEQILSNDGNILMTDKGITNEDHDEEMIFDKNWIEQRRITDTNMHLICKDSSETVETGNNSVHWDDDRYIDFPTEDEMNRLLMKNDDGDYLFHSITKISGYETDSLTIIKNNDFNPEKYQELCDSLPSDLNKWGNDRTKEYQSRMKEWAIENGASPKEKYPWIDMPGSEEAMAKVSADLDKEFGPNIQNFLQENYSTLIEESGVKIKYQKNKDLPIKEHDDYNSYRDDWEDYHEMEFMEDYGGEDYYDYDGPVSSGGRGLDFDFDDGDASYDAWKDEQAMHGYGF